MDSSALPGSTSVGRLQAEAAEAAALRACLTHPDVVALRIERVRSWFDRIVWTGIALCLSFTMINVQMFAANGAEKWSLPWLAAWLLDPAVSAILIAVLLAEQVTSRWLPTPGWARVAKWFALAATYTMNTWQSWDAGAAAQIVLHSVPPLMVFVAVEAAPAMRERLTEAVHRAITEHPTGGRITASDPPRETPPAPVRDVADGAVREPFTTPVREPLANRAGVIATEPTTEIHEPTTNSLVPARSKPPRRGGRSSPAPRRLLPEFVEEARTALAAARVAGTPVEPTPTWCRQVTGCSAGTSVKVSAALRESVSGPDNVRTLTTAR